MKIKLAMNMKLLTAISNHEGLKIEEKRERDGYLMLTPPLKL